VDVDIPFWVIPLPANRSFFQKTSFLFKKGVYRLAIGAYNPPPPTGCGATNYGDADWTVRVSALEFFDIVDQ